MDDEMQAMDAGGLELERRLDAFARARLSPDPQASARIRARVMREARLHGEAARIAAHIGPAIEIRHRSPVRRLAMPFLAAAVWLSIAVGTIAAAQAGGLLYPTRLWIEAATLPSVGAARIDADLQRLDTRVGEVLAAATRGDGGAVAAALDAYDQTAQDATASSAASPDLQARVEAALSRHQAVLTAVAAGLADKGNDTAANAIERNIQRSIERNAAKILDLKPGQGNGNPNAGGNGNGNGNPNAGGNGNANPPAGGNANGTPPAGGNGNPPAGGNGNPPAGGNGNGNPNAATPAPAGPPADKTPKPKHTPRGNQH